jgi:hypothetical protein
LTETPAQRAARLLGNSDPARQNMRTTLPDEGALPPRDITPAPKPAEPAPGTAAPEGTAPKPATEPAPATAPPSEVPGGTAPKPTEPTPGATSGNSSQASAAPVPVVPNVSPTLTAQELLGKTAAEIRQLAKDKGLVPHPTKPDKWLDPVTGKERLRIDPGHIDKQTGLPYNDPKAAAPHHHAYGPDGKTKIVDPADQNPHIPTVQPPPPAPPTTP